MTIRPRQTSYPLLDELKSAHREYLIAARKKVMERCADTERGEPDEQELRELVEADATLEKLQAKHQRVVQKLDEKIAIAAQSYDIVDHHIRRLDQDLDAYAVLLKQNGEFEEEKTLKKQKTSKGALSTAAAAATTASSSSTPVAASSTKSSKLSTAAAAASGASGVSSNSASALSMTTGSGRKRSATEATLEIPAAVRIMSLYLADWV